MCDNVDAFSKHYTLFKHYAEWKQPVTEVLIQHNSISTKSYVGSSVEGGNRFGVARVTGRGLDNDCYWAWDFFFCNDEIWDCIVVVNVELCDYTRNHRVMHLKELSFMVCKLLFGLDLWQDWSFWFKFEDGIFEIYILCW